MKPWDDYMRQYGAEEYAAQAKFERKVKRMSRWDTWITGLILLGLVAVLADIAFWVVTLLWLVPSAKWWFLGGVGLGFVPYGFGKLVERLDKL